MTGAVGTLAWSSPEMLLGARCTERSDIYSYGERMRGCYLHPDALLCVQSCSASIVGMLLQAQIGRSLSWDMQIRHTHPHSHPAAPL